MQKPTFDELLAEDLEPVRGGQARRRGIAFGSATFEVARHFYGTDRIAFSFVSDELNGITRDNKGNVRPHLMRRFSSLSQAEDERPGATSSRTPSSRWA